MLILVKPIKTTIKDSNGSFAYTKGQMTKISLYYKPLTIKASFLVIILLSLATIPLKANAGFFSDIVTTTKKVIGVDGQIVNASTFDDTKVTGNSQTLALLESSVAPDNNKKELPVVTIDEGEALVPLIGPLGPATDIVQYVSTAKITTYTVKKGDNLGNIAKKFKITENTILYSNSDLKKTDLLRIGQVLVILPLKSQSDIKVIDKNIAKSTPTIVAEKPIVKKIKLEPTKETKDETEDTFYTINIGTTRTASQPPLQTSTIITPIGDSQATEPSTPTGQPSGNITGGYMWPFPEGVGRVSQGLHADQAYDFAAPTGTPIYAPEGGTVLIARPTGYNGGYGKYVVINFTDGRQAIFGHMSKVSVQEGDIVKQGDTIGNVGSTGRSTGPHVHIGFHGSLGNPYLGLKVNSKDLVIND